MKFYLKWLRDDEKPVQLPGWSERIGQRFYNRVGGWHSGPLKNYRIVGSVDLPDWESIEHSEDARALMLKAALIVQKNLHQRFPDHDMGWIDPGGGWTPCWFQDHDAMALYAFGRPVREIESTHIRVWGLKDGFSSVISWDGKMMPAQARMLKRLGHEVHWSEIQ